MLYLSNHALKLISLKCYKMDKKSIVNDLYQAAVMSVFAVGYSMLGKKILKMTPPSIQKFDLAQETGCYRSCVRDDQRVSYQTEDLTRMHQCLKMVSVAMLIRGALANTLAFIGSSYLFNRISKDSIDTKRKRHNLVIEQLPKAQIKWAQLGQQQTDFISKQLRLE